MACKGNGNRDANGRFILTGSQKFSLMKKVSDSLAGRCGVLELEGLSIKELGDVFHDREQREGVAGILVRGFMPQLWKDLDLPPSGSTGTSPGRWTSSSRRTAG